MHGRSLNALAPQTMRRITGYHTRRNISNAALHHSVLNGARGALRFVRRRVPLPLPVLDPTPQAQNQQQNHQQQQHEKKEGVVMPYVVIADSFAAQPHASISAAAGMRRAPTNEPREVAERPSSSLPPTASSSSSAAAPAAAAAAPAPAPAPAPPAPAAAASKPEPATPVPSHQSAAGCGAASELLFARHLCGAANGAAPLAARMESLSWLVFQAGRAQASLRGDPRRPDAWIGGGGGGGPAGGGGGLALLERVYLVGGALADVGGADALYVASLAGGGGGGGIGGLASNGQRAVAAMDYASLLARYLAQHGAVLSEQFVAALPSDELQAKAVHVASRLETRCAVHRLVFEQLIARVGAEAAAAYDGGARGAATAPVTVIQNATTTVAAQGGASSAAMSVPPSPCGAGGPIVGLFVGVVALASGAVRFAVAVLFALGSGAAKALALGSLLAAVRAAASVGRVRMPPSQPMPVAAMSAGSAPSAALFGGQQEQQQQQQQQQKQQQQKQPEQQQPEPQKDVQQKPQPLQALATLFEASTGAAQRGAHLAPEPAAALPISEALRRQQLRVFGGGGIDLNDDDW